jgi:threonine dehydrogenase-like Zn-dependent dehydrogenase
LDGTTVYIAGAGPVGLAAAAGAQLLGAAVVIVGDMIPERLAQAKSFGCEVIDLKKDATLAQQIEQILGEPVVDCAVDCVGFEAHGQGKEAGVEKPATVLNSLVAGERQSGFAQRAPSFVRISTRRIPCRRVLLLSVSLMKSPPNETDCEVGRSSMQALAAGSSIGLGIFPFFTSCSSFLSMGVIPAVSFILLLPECC